MSADNIEAQLEAYRKARRAAILRRYYESHKEQIKARNTAWYKNHKDVANACTRKYRAAHREEINAQNRAHREAHREEINARQRELRRQKKEAKANADRSKSEKAPLAPAASPVELAP